MKNEEIHLKSKHLSFKAVKKKKKKKQNFLFKYMMDIKARRLSVCLAVQFFRKTWKDKIKTKTRKKRHKNYYTIIIITIITIKPNWTDAYLGYVQHKQTN